MEHGPRAARSQPGSIARLDAEIGRLQARIAELERENARVASFAAVAAHELLAPLVLTDAYAMTIADRLDDELHADSRRDLDAMRRAAARARLLVETLLHAARSDEGELRRRPIDLNRVLRDCLTLLGPEIHSRAADVQVAALPEVDGDEILISAVFANLLLNALRYGPRRHGTIVVDASREAAVWRFSVQSAGPSIRPVDRARIFAPYQRGLDERRARGAGLGLTICRQIVERHGGEIGVTVAEGGENRFWFTLRRAGERPGPQRA